MVTVLPEYLPYLPKAAQSPLIVAALILVLGCLPGSGTPEGAAPPLLLAPAVFPPPLPLLLLLLLHAAAVVSASRAATPIDTFLDCIKSRPSQARAQKALAAPWHVFPLDWKSVARALSSFRT